jgi:predicted acylesterase/phospholipase RssA
MTESVSCEGTSIHPESQQSCFAGLSRDKPLSIVLGAGGVRGMAHVGLLELLIEREFRITEMIGTSVGALIISFYAAVGLSLAELRELGLNLTSRHLLEWAWLRRAPKSIQHRLESRAGIIPATLQRLSETSGQRLHHGIERIGLLCFDRSTRSEMMFDNVQGRLRLEDATRGAAAIPGLFPSRNCVVEGRRLRLVDGGVSNRLPVDKLFEPPFKPQQILAVDISNNDRQREEARRKVEGLRAKHPEVPMVVISPDTNGKGTVIYHRGDLQVLIDAGKRAALQALS